MSTKEALNRATNLVGVSIISLAGFAFLPEIFIEDELNHRLDDISLFVIGILAIIWYKQKKNSVSHSLTPVMFVAAGLIIKVISVMVEFKDQADVGDEFGGLILFAIATAFVYYLYRRSKSSSMLK